MVRSMVFIGSVLYSLCAMVIDVAMERLFSGTVG